LKALRASCAAAAEHYSIEAMAERFLQGILTALR
jgi:hypothetical protein